MRHHVTVGDVADLVRQYCLGLILAHRPQQSATYRYQGVIARHTGGKGIHIRRVVNRDFRHTDTGRFRLAAHRAQQPLFGGIGR